MGKMLYLEGASGIAGDMTVAALLDLGGSQEKLFAALDSLMLGEEMHCHVKRAESYGIAGAAFNVHCHNEHHHHHSEEHHHHDHEHEHHHHEDHHDHHHHHGGHHEHVHRNLADVLEVINRGNLSARARELAEKTFRIVAEAEAKAHGCAVQEVHFHEVGAVDSIADIVGAAVLIDDLDITDCVVESLAEGQGTVHCQHGELPVPVPAVLNIAAASGIALRKTDAKGEMVTPTGIAIAAAMRTSDHLPEVYRVCQVGVGVGKRDFGRPNILRAMLIEDAAADNAEQVWVLESNIDDSTGEQLGWAMEKLMQASALDVSYTPCFMKKNRPGYLLRVIAYKKDIAALERMIFRVTSTIGVRRYPVERSCMSREAGTVQTPYGVVTTKKCHWQDVEKVYPEYESVKALAEASGADFFEVYKAALSGDIK